MSAGGLPRTRTPRFWVVAGLFVLYTLFILSVTLSPSQIDPSVQGWVYRVVEAAQRLGAPGWFDYDAIEFGANIGMFVPFGFLLALLLTSRWAWLAVFIAMALSTGIEVFQREFLPARVFDPRDIVANSVGAIIGVAGAAVFRAVIRPRRKRVIARTV